MVQLFIKIFADYYNMIAARLKALQGAKQTNTQEYVHLVLVHTRLRQMADYIAHGDWARKPTRAKYVFWFRHNYDYAITAVQYKTSDKCIRVLVSRADAVLSKIMAKPLQQIKDGNVNDGWVEFNFNINRLDLNELFGRPILMAMPNPCDLEKNYALEDCKDEIKFLRAYNSYNIRHGIECLDAQKLAYLLALGSVTDPTYIEERKRLVKLILHIK